jgi:dTMP kinase
VEVGLNRARRRIENSALAGREDRFEQQALAFHQKVRDGYLNLAAQHPERFKIFDATMELERLHDEIVTILDSYLEQKN